MSTGRRAAIAAGAVGVAGLVIAGPVLGRVLAQIERRMNPVGPGVLPPVSEPC